MAAVNVNPTRMELSRLKKRLQVARRGHKLLKDKRDEMMKTFLELARTNMAFRRMVEEELMAYHEAFLNVKAVMPAKILEEALLFPKQTVFLQTSSSRVMNVDVPRFSFHAAEEVEIYPYGFASTSGELDHSMEILASVLPKMLELAEKEKAAQLLSNEIEKTRRRVNALEYVLIPQLTASIRYLALKLEENERGNLTRLMKVKDMMIEQARKAAEQAEEAADGGW